jgi:hypothetical protein
MEKYLFTDGSGELQEVQSEEELQALIRASANRHNIRIWRFNSNEWISYADFTKQPQPVPASNGKPVQVTEELLITQPPKKKGWLKKTLLFTLAGTTVFLVYNFTRIRWVKMAPLHTSAARPANVPSIDTDSVIALIESVRGQKVDRTTRTNLRIRNNWPERILLHLDADRDSSSLGMKFSNITLTLDNATGYLLDDAIVQLTSWSRNDGKHTDTIHFSNTSYETPAKRSVNKEICADSITLTFSSIRARSFNFCYSIDKESNYGNLGDKWFCKD